MWCGIMGVGEIYNVIFGFDIVCVMVWDMFVCYFYDSDFYYIEKMWYWVYGVGFM